MHRLITLIILFVVFCVGCTGQNKNPEEFQGVRVQEIGKEKDIKPVTGENCAEEDIKPVTGENSPEEDFKPVSVKKYLFENGIQIDSKSISKETLELSLSVSYPEIKGLVDKRLQEKLNREFKENAQKFIDKPIPVQTAMANKQDSQGKKYEKWSTFSTITNCNNILSMKFYFKEMYGTEIIEKQEIMMTYELTSGKKLSIKDLFDDDVDGIKMVNERLVNCIIRENLEEFGLSGPFQGIALDQPFNISESQLSIIFDERNPEFIYPGYMIIIPFEEFGGAIKIFDKYLDSKKKLYDKDELKKILIPLSLKEKWDIKKEIKPEYEILFQIQKFENMENRKLQKKINSLCSDFDSEDFIKSALEAYEVYSEKSSRYVKLSVNAYYSDVLSLYSYDRVIIMGQEETFQNRLYNYNTKTGEEIALKDLFNNEFDYKKIIKENIQKQFLYVFTPEELGKLDAEIDRAEFYLNDTAIGLVFKAGKVTAYTGEVQIKIPFEDFGQNNLTLFN